MSMVWVLAPGFTSKLASAHLAGPMLPWALFEKAKGSVSEAARLAGLDRTNFRRLLQRHGIDAASFK